MIVYKLSKQKYKNDISGKGAEIAGGRWNNLGTAILYTTENRALCASEIAVHTPFGIFPTDYYLVNIKLPKCKIETISIEKLPKKWNTFPHLPTTKKIGDEFIKLNKNLVLKVPSAIVQDEFNYLINPNHPKFADVKILKTQIFKFDVRMFKRK